MNVLIIGGTGLISTGITRQLAARGERVTLYNRGQRAAEVPGVPQIHGDRTDYAAFEAQMAAAGPFDAVIDMVAYKPEDVESAIRAFAGRVEQYVFCSTVDVYTKPAARYPVTEDAAREPSPNFGYAFDKARCERILEAAHARGDFAVTTIRPAWTYGEGGGLLHTFGWDTFVLRRLRRGEPVIVHGDGTSFWVACHRDDVARAFVNALGNAAAYGRAYHVTGETWLTWDAYHRALAEALEGPPPALVHIPTDLLREAAPRRAFWCAENFRYNNLFDNAAARADLDFRCTVPFAEGARRAIAWLEAHGGFETTPPWYTRLLASWQRLAEGMAPGAAARSPGTPADVD